jgi:precorrin-6A/cobalt-precorrin-6A reductase
VTRRLLILGGTAEARALAALATARFGPRLEVIVSLAGRTRAPQDQPGALRVGGFGGASGLADYLKAERIDFLVDATHPFAAAMSDHAVVAAAQAGVTLLRLERPAWDRQPGDRWIEVPDAAAAARAVATLGTRIFLSFGGKELDAFSALADKWFLVRRIDEPLQALPLPHYALVLGRAPFAIESETALLQEHLIEAVVTKASGGAETSAKLDAARALGLPVVMIARPVKAGAATVWTPDEALARIAAVLFPVSTIDGAAAVSA